MYEAARSVSAPIFVVNQNALGARHGRVRRNWPVVWLVFALLTLNACAEKPESPITIAVNPWPGYAYLYLAEELGYFKQQGLNIKLAHFDSLGDSLQAYLNGRVDGFAGTIVESVQAHYRTSRPITVIFAADYSNGADVILARQGIERITGLRGKRVGVELSALGIYMLERALILNDMNIEDIELVFIEQGDASDFMRQHRVDAYVSYPPFSIELSKQASNTIFSSAEIPYEILDTIALANDVLQQQQDFIPSFRQAWSQALAYAHQHPDRAAQLMAKKLSMELDDFKLAQSGSVLLDLHAQQELFVRDREKLVQTAQHVCRILRRLKVVQKPCDKNESLILAEDLKRG